MKRILQIMLSGLFVALLAACGGPVEVVMPDSPLAAESPLAPPASETAADDGYAYPDRPYLLFYSSRGEQWDWYLFDPTTDEVMPAPRPNVEGYRLDSLSWMAELNFFLARMTDAQGESDLYLMDFAGEIPARLTFDSYEEGDAVYSPANGSFAYVCLQQDLDICVTRANEPEMTNLTALNTRESNPDWSPDGETVLFVSNAAGVVNVWAMDPDGANRRNLSAVGLGDTLWEEGDPTWSPDGESILFRSRADDNADIYLMDPDGTNRRNLTSSPATDTNPKWSPDGQHIAFRSDSDGEQDIYVLTLADSTLVNVTNSPAMRKNNFVWSGDGEHIYFDNQVDGVFDIYVARRDGTELRNLTDSDADDLDPQWIE